MGFERFTDMNRKEWLECQIQKCIKELKDLINKKVQLEESICLGVYNTDSGLLTEEIDNITRQTERLESQISLINNHINPLYLELVDMDIDKFIKFRNEIDKIIDVNV